MATLVIVALFWGNCFSCPQVLLASKLQTPAHGCCHKTKQTNPGCHTQALQNFVKGDAVTHAAAMPVAIAAGVAAPVVARVADATVAHVEHDPPGGFFSLRI